MKRWLGAALLFTTTLTAEIVTRAAIDWGSGSVKVQVSEVDTDANRLIGEPLLSYQLDLFLTLDVAEHGGVISPGMQDQAIAMMRAIKEQVETEFGQVPFSGIATAIFRKAPNGPALLERCAEELGLRFRIISQEEEGQLGFQNAHALFPDIPADQLVAWDNGSSSFQMTSQYNVLGGQVGYGVIRVLLQRDIRNIAIDAPVYPINADEAAQLTAKIRALLPTQPDWLTSDLSFGVWGMPNGRFFSVVDSYGIVHRGDLDAFIASYLGLSEAQVISDGYPHDMLISSIYFTAIMEHYGIDTLHFAVANGNLPGLLISPQYWQ
jgi:hypothetical protein